MKKPPRQFVKIQRLMIRILLHLHFCMNMGSSLWTFLTMTGNVLLDAFLKNSEEDFEVVYLTSIRMGRLRTSGPQQNFSQNSIQTVNDHLLLLYKMLTLAKINRRITQDRPLKEQKSQKDQEEQYAKFVEDRIRNFNASTLDDCYSKYNTSKYECTYFHFDTMLIPAKFQLDNGVKGTMRVVGQSRPICTSIVKTNEDMPFYDMRFIFHAIEYHISINGGLYQSFLGDFELRAKCKAKDEEIQMDDMITKLKKDRKLVSRQSYGQCIGTHFFPFSYFSLMEKKHMYLEEFYLPAESIKSACMHVYDCASWTSQKTVPIDIGNINNAHIEVDNDAKNRNKYIVAANELSLSLTNNREGLPGVYISRSEYDTLKEEFWRKRDASIIKIEDCCEDHEDESWTYVSTI